MLTFAGLIKQLTNHEHASDSALQADFDEEAADALPHHQIHFSQSPHAPLLHAVHGVHGSGFHSVLLDHCHGIDAFSLYQVLQLHTDLLTIPCFDVRSDETSGRGLGF